MLEKMKEYFTSLFDSANIKAERNYQKGKYKTARRQYRSSKMTDKAMKCSILLKDWQDLQNKTKASNLELSGLYAIMNNDLKFALKIFSDSDKALTASLHYFNKNYDKAIENLVYTKDIQRIRQVCEQQNLIEKWIDIELQFSNIEKAVEVSNQYKTWKQISNYFEQGKDYFNAGINYEKQGSIDRAIDMFLNTESMEDVRRICNANQLFFKLGEIEFSKENYTEALASFEKDNNLEKQAVCHEKLGNHTKARECRIELWKQEAYNGNEESFDKLLSLYQKEQNIREIRILCSKVEKFVLLGEIEEEYGNYDDAFDAYETAERHDKIALLLEKLEMWKDAANAWKLAWEWERAINALRKAGDNEDADGLEQTLNTSNSLRNGSLGGKQLDEWLSKNEIVFERYGTDVHANFILPVEQPTSYVYTGAIVATFTDVLVGYTHVQSGLGRMAGLQKSKLKGVIRIPYKDINNIEYYSPNLLGKLSRFGSSGPKYYQKILISFDNNGHLFHFESASRSNKDEKFDSIRSLLKLKTGIEPQERDAFTIL